MTPPTKGLVERLEEEDKHFLGQRPSVYREAATAIRELTEAIAEQHEFLSKTNLYKDSEYKKLISNLLSKYQPEDKSNAG